MDSSAPFSKLVKNHAQRIAESGPMAVAGLFDLVAQRLVRYAATITRNQHDAEDAIQGVLVNVMRDPSCLERADTAWPYLLRMTRNQALLILRRKRKWSLVQNLSDLLTKRSVDELEQEDTQRAVWLALRRLPNEQSEVIVLKIWESLTFAEIAEILQASPATVASRYRYGMDKLSRMLHAFDTEVVHES